MRYIVIFSDRTTKRVNERQAEAFRNAMRTRGTVDFRGCTYAGYSIVAVKTIVGFYEDRRNEIESRCMYFCQFGYEHENRSDCLCKEARKEPFLTKEEAAIIPKLSAPNEDEMPLLRAPQ